MDCLCCAFIYYFRLIFVEKTSLPIYTIEITFIGYEISTICNDEGIQNIFVERVSFIPNY